MLTSQEEKYQELADCLRSQKSDGDKYLEWRHCGPPNKRLVYEHLLYLFLQLFKECNRTACGLSLRPRRRCKVLQ